MTCFGYRLPPLGSSSAMTEDSKRGDVEPDEPLPGSVSNQNAEEEQPGQGGSGEHRESSEKASSGSSGPSGGESSEGSQSTGNPASAG